MHENNACAIINFQRNARIVTIVYRRSDIAIHVPRYLVIEPFVHYLTLSDGQITFESRREGSET